MNNNAYVVADMGENKFYFCDSRKIAKEIATRLLFKRKEELFEEYTSKIYDRLNDEKDYHTEFGTFWDFVMGIIENDELLFDYDINIYKKDSPDIITSINIDDVIGKNY